MELIQDLTEKMCFEDGEFNELEKAILSISERIVGLVSRDEMTSLLNRRFIDERLPTELTNACLSDIPLSIIFMDIDSFKDINDKFGHLAGDQVIRRVAQIIEKSIRLEDNWAARYGGDEFLLCCPGADNRAAIKIAEKIRKRIEKETFKIDNDFVTVTCSFGVRTINSGDRRLSAHDLINQADRNLYEAKNSGKNRVV
ncbi:MAG: GGDEF domain-containing protein [Oscillospiraceae bacterium]|nr:GGDEF domain-containing protein [Oscillospiraceae bacterium]